MYVSTALQADQCEPGDWSRGQDWTNRHSTQVPSPTGTNTCQFWPTFDPPSENGQGQRWRYCSDYRKKEINSPIF